MHVKCINFKKIVVFVFSKITSHNSLSGNQSRRFGSKPKQERSNKYFWRVHFFILALQRSINFSFFEFLHRLIKRLSILDDFLLKSRIFVPYIYWYFKISIDCRTIICGSYFHWFFYLPLETIIFAANLKKFLI